jgi:double-stranded uracil-DNA glycosylase
MRPPVRSFAPLVPPRARLLILGSVPGLASLQANEYYGHPQNAFWRIAEALFGVAHTLPYAMRIEALAAQGVALWDVLASCERESSLDADIRAETIVPNAIGPLLASLPHVERIGCNGGAAARYFARYIAPDLAPAQQRVPVVSLPSTSPAFAAMRPHAKAERWSELLGVPPVKPYPHRL